MKVGGIIDISTKDIPGISSFVIFTVGCNLHCKFCHNKYLLNKNVGKELDVREIINQIKSNMLVSGVSITGGEPTLQPDLLELCKHIQKVGKFLNVDTNGTHPEVIKNLLPFIDKISLDLKSPLKKQRYSEITTTDVDPKLIIETFNIVNNRKEIDFEIRTTYVEKLMVPEDIHKILSFLKKNKFRGKFVLQQYQYSNGVGEKYKEIYYIPEHSTLLNIVKKFRKDVLSFEIYIRDKVVGYKKLNEIKAILD